MLKIDIFYFLSPFWLANPPFFPSPTESSSEFYEISFLVPRQFWLFSSLSFSCLFSSSVLLEELCEVNLCFKEQPLPAGSAHSGEEGDPPLGVGVLLIPPLEQVGLPVVGEGPEADGSGPAHEAEGASGHAAGHHALGVVVGGSLQGRLVGGGRGRGDHLALEQVAAELDVDLRVGKCRASCKYSNLQTWYY